MKTNLTPRRIDDYILHSAESLDVAGEDADILEGLRIRGSIDAISAIRSAALGAPSEPLYTAQPLDLHLDWSELHMRRAPYDDDHLSAFWYFEPGHQFLTNYDDICLSVEGTGGMRVFDESDSNWLFGAEAVQAAWMRGWTDLDLMDESKVRISSLPRFTFWLWDANDGSWQPVFDGPPELSNAPKDYYQALKIMTEWHNTHGDQSLGLPYQELWIERMAQTDEPPYPKLTQDDWETLPDMDEECNTCAHPAVFVAWSDNYSAWKVIYLARGDSPGMVYSWCSSQEFKTWREAETHALSAIVEVPFMWHCPLPDDPNLRAYRIEPFGLPYQESWIERMAQQTDEAASPS